MALSKIAATNGIEAERQRLQAIDPGRTAHNHVFGEPGKKYAESSVPAEGTLKKLVAGHNDYVAFKELMESRPF
jgi:hypothetical protein